MVSDGSLTSLTFVLVVAPLVVGTVVALGSRVREAIRPTLPVSFAFGE